MLSIIGSKSGKKEIEFQEIKTGDRKGPRGPKGLGKARLGVRLG